MVMNPKSSTAMKNNRNGWLKIHYSLLDWEWYDDLPTRVLFQHLLLRANYADAVWHGIPIKRGQILTSRATLVKESGLTEQQVRTALKHLISTNEITTEVTNKYTIVTICNYVVYQGEENETNQQNNQQNNNQVTNNQPATNQQLTTRKEEYNNRRKKEKEDLKENISINRDKKENEPKFNFKTALLDLGVPPELVDEWLVIRKKKGGINTKIAFDVIVREANKAGITVAEAVAFSAQRQYRGFEAQWYINSIRDNNGIKVEHGYLRSPEEMQKIVECGRKLYEQSLNYK